jgi:50S ribosomal protein L16 3-hydroxylase
MTPNPLLGGMTPEVFLADYWHKKPLLIRGALTNVGEPVGFDWLAKLATQDEVESRLIEFKGGRWSLERGPFRSGRLRKLPPADWTLLVQNVNHHLPHIADILWRFDFIPYARLDDLMISYAPPGGTVGPHFDSYDVFLLQVGGKKSWKIAAQDDATLVEDAPLKILKHFKAEEEFTLEHGDMLYLPPRYAHYGVALEPGMTYSIGFRAPSAQELATQFLVYLQDRLELEGMYADPELAWQAEPARISEQMIAKVLDTLSRIRWQRGEVADFLGHYLTEPKPHVFFEGEEEELDRDAFAKMAQHRGIQLDLKSLLLYVDGLLYCNGERLDINAGDLAAWQTLANRRALPGAAVTDEMLDLLYEGYQIGFWHPAEAVVK